MRLLSELCEQKLSLASASFLLLSEILYRAVAEAWQARQRTLWPSTNTSNLLCVTSAFMKDCVDLKAWDIQHWILPAKRLALLSPTTPPNPPRPPGGGGGGGGAATTIRTYLTNIELGT